MAAAELLNLIDWEGSAVLGEEKVTKDELGAEVARRIRPRLDRWAAALWYRPD